MVHPREVFRLAIGKGVKSVLLAHNHPSGDPAPSDKDRAITTRLRQAGDILGIEVLDHVIVGEENAYYSFREGGEW
jgi:DNA repair protein RadC